MIYRDIAGQRMPALGFGTWQLEGKACREAVACALEVGYRHIDTARMYGNEADVGRALDESGIERDELFVTTKLWWEDLSADGVRRQLDASLGDLRLDAVDLLLIHWPNPEVPLRATLEAMREVADEGRTRHIGVSNFPSADLRRALDMAPVRCNQVEYHPLLAQPALCAMVAERGIVLTAYCPLAQGQVLDESEIRSIAREVERTPVQVTLRWLLQQDAVAAIPRSANPEHIRANFDVFDFELDQGQMQRLHRLGQRGARLVDPSWSPDWDALRADQGTQA